MLTITHNLYWVDGWLADVGEPRAAGVLLAECRRLDEALYLSTLWPRPAAYRHGNGQLVVLDRFGELVAGPFPAVYPTHAPAREPALATAWGNV